MRGAVVFFTGGDGKVQHHAWCQKVGPPAEQSAIQLGDLRIAVTRAQVAFGDGPQRLSGLHGVPGCGLLARVADGRRAFVGSSLLYRRDVERDWRAVCWLNRLASGVNAVDEDR